MYFNSIKVQLEHASSSEQDALLKFQFHKGTIRTGAAAGAAAGGVPFQFHKGTIRTFHTKRVYRLPRLFQFHKGTIRTR